MSPTEAEDWAQAKRLTFSDMMKMESAQRTEVIRTMTPQMVAEWQLYASRHAPADWTRSAALMGSMSRAASVEQVPVSPGGTHAASGSTEQHVLPRPPSKSGTQPNNIGGDAAGAGRGRAAATQSSLARQVATQASVEDVGTARVVPATQPTVDPNGATVATAASTLAAQQQQHQQEAAAAPAAAAGAAAAAAQPARSPLLPGNSTSSISSAERRARITALDGTEPGGGGGHVAGSTPSSVGGSPLPQGGPTRARPGSSGTRWVGSRLILRCC